MMETTQRERIEVLVDAPLAPQLERLAREAGITGHTLIRTESGQGRHGKWSEDLVSGATAKYIFLTIANSQRADAFQKALLPLLESHSLVVLRSTVNVIRPDRF